MKYIYGQAITILNDHKNHIQNWTEVLLIDFIDTFINLLHNINTHIIYIIAKMQGENKQPKPRWYSSFCSIKRDKSIKKISNTFTIVFPPNKQKKERVFSKIFQHHINKLSYNISKYECIYKSWLIMLLRTPSGIMNARASMNAKMRKLMPTRWSDKVT